MFSDYFTFARIRILCLSYIAAVSFLTFAIALFVLPTSGKIRTPALTTIAGVSIVIALVASGALIAPRFKCCQARIIHGREARMYVGLELLLCVASLPLLATAIFLEEQVAAVHPLYSLKAGGAPNLNEGRTLSTLLLVFSCSATVILTTYTALLGGLAFYTHKRTRRTNVWFADVAARAPAFVFPRSLRFLSSQEDSDSEAGSSENDTENRRQAHRAHLRELEEENPALLSLMRQLHMPQRSAHTLGPGCACGEKMPWRPSHPDEYRALSQVYARVWALVAEREALARARTLGVGLGHRRSLSAPVPIFRLPTERERRRSLYVVGFDGAHFG